MVVAILAVLGSFFMMLPADSAPVSSPPAAGRMPALPTGASWINSPPLTAEGLRGKVVLVDFWTYSCINCLRSMPYVNAWYDKYKDHGLAVIGVHAPEFAFEKDVRNVKRAIAKYSVHYPVVLDNDSKLWKAFDNHYWPAHYFIDAQGRIRGHHSGEGDYAESEQTIRKLLTEAGYKDLPSDRPVVPEASGAQAKGAYSLSEETYLGYSRTENFSSPGGVVRNKPHTYAVSPALKLNQWALEGSWNVKAGQSALAVGPGKVVFRFRARDLHLVLGPGADGKPVRFRVQLDGVEPGADHGMDIDAAGSGVVEEHRLYQLIRQSDGVQEHTFSIEFLDGGVQAYAFTFG